ncbi:hypothetical protein E8E11_002653 [Didymella keratinophila]|nr:hypothetical protein E8E11_002653 [Didymella keratinophila]
MPFFPCWKQKTVPPPLGGLPEDPVQTRTLMWNSDRYARWGPVLSTTSTNNSIHHESRTEDPVLTEHYFPILTRILLTSNLGMPDKQYNLRFSCIIPGDRPLAMFTTAKYQSKIAWFNGPNRGRCLPETRWWRRSGIPRMRSACTVQCTISNRWHYKIRRDAVIRWDPHWEILLVDHRKLLADYEAQEKDEKNKKRVAKIVENYHLCERSQLGMATGGGWSNWGDWDIWPATLPEVAQTCRLNGRELEKRLLKGRRPGSGKRCKIRRCLREVSRRLKKVFSKS